MESVPFADYEKWPQLNVSLLAQAWKSWKQFKYARDFGYRPRIDTRVGSALHSLAECLPLDRFDELFVAMPDYKMSPDNVTGKGVRSTSKTKWVDEQEAAFRKANEGTEILSNVERSRCRRMLKAIEDNEEAFRLITESLCEVSLRANLSGVECKGRPDGVHISDNCLWDLKTARDVSPRAFGNVTANLHYVFRLAFYWLLLRQHGMEAQTVKLIAVQDSVPFADGSFNEVAECVVYDVPLIALENEFPEIDRLLLEYQRCVEQDAWPGMPNAPLFIPNWAMREPELV